MYKLDLNNPSATFLVQTIPLKEGNFSIKTQFLNADGTNQTIYDSETTKKEDTGPFAPFGITYAVFGSNSSNPNNAANYSFNDGNNSHVLAYVS